MKRIGVLTSGGDSQGMNAAIYATVRYGISCGMEVYGIFGGYKGLIDGRVRRFNPTDVDGIMNRGGTILGTSRCLEMKTTEGRKSAAKTLTDFGIEGLVVIGGDGSFQGAKALSEQNGVKVVGIPGTIDNDLPYTDFTVGFDSAVTVVVNCVGMLRDTMGCNNRTCVVEVMGRNCGDIALHSALTSSSEVVIVPEVGYNPQEVAGRLSENISHGKFDNMIIVAEGVQKAANVLADIQERVPGISARSVVLGHIQRGGNASCRDVFLGTRMGVKAVECLAADKTNRVIGVRQGQIFDQDLLEALAVKRPFDLDLYKLANRLVDSF